MGRVASTKKKGKRFDGYDDDDDDARAMAMTTTRRAGDK